MATKHEHQCWMNSRAYDFVADVEKSSRRLRDAIADGAKLDAAAPAELELVAERLLKIAQKAKNDGTEA